MKAKLLHWTYRIFRHAKDTQRFFDTFDSLEPGDKMILINDHDPKPLKYQLDAERTGQMDWEYILSGPEEWKVEITKK